MPVWPLTDGAAFRLTVVAIALWSTLSSLEMLVVLPAFRVERALGSELALLRRGRLRRPPWSWLFSSSISSSLALLRLVAGIALPFAPGAAVAVALLVIVAGCTMLVSIATEGSDGADKIAVVACGAALLVGLGQLFDDRLLGLAGVAWGAGQLTIAYVASGAAKLVRPFWRDGTAITAAMTSYRSGHAAAAAIVRHRAAALILAWSLMLIEIAFPLTLLVPASVSLAILAVFAVFHVATAIVMGLNTYPWGFMACYPFVLTANGLIRGAVGLSS